MPGAVADGQRDALSLYHMQYITCPSPPVGWVVGTSVGTRIGMPAAEGFAQVSCGAQGQLPATAGLVRAASGDRRVPGWQAT